MRFILALSIVLYIQCNQQALAFQNSGDNALAFPGAQGFGKFTRGGRGGKVLIVSNLNDRGAGSLREALSRKEPRIIVFSISGTIALESQLDINHGDVTIAGQSAPGDGICIRNYSVRINSDNVLIRYMRFRMGDLKKEQNDAVYGLRHKDIMIDHCSMSWSTDECASFYDNQNFTLQWCIIAESLNASVHEKGEHGYGGIWGGMGASFHHNLLAHHNSRNPRFCGARYHKQPEKEIVDFRNNVIYNWGINSSYAGERGNHNMVNNYYKPGPATPLDKANRILNPWSPFGKYYINGNVVEGNAAVTANNWNGGVQGDHVDSAFSNNEIPVEKIKQQTAQEAYAAVLSNAGASYFRDAVDKRIVDDVQKGVASHGKNANGIIDSQTDVGGWPELLSKKLPTDTDQDGMPDDWEKKHKLNFHVDDSSGFNLDKSYTNVEVYLNSLLGEK
jgi:hypothetical protein